MQNDLDIICATEMCSKKQREVGYLKLLAADGRTLEQAAAATLWEVGDIKQAAREHDIQFSDYNPQSKPLRLEWRKEDKGWGLYKKKSDDRIGECYRDTTRGVYIAKSLDKSYTLTSARAAMRKLSVCIDKASISAFGKEHLTFTIEGKGGDTLVLFP